MQVKVGKRPLFAQSGPAARVRFVPEADMTNIALYSSINSGLMHQPGQHLAEGLARGIEAMSIQAKQAINRRQRHQFLKFRHITNRFLYAVLIEYSHPQSGGYRRNHTCY